jgi:hypothetical protein
MFLKAAKYLLRERGEVRMFLRENGEIAFRTVETGPPVTVDDL